jgi:hypothetical protein
MKERKGRRTPAFSLPQEKGDGMFRPAVPLSRWPLHLTCDVCEKEGCRGSLRSRHGQQKRRENPWRICDV